MMHKAKKLAAGVTTKRSPDSIEYADLCNKLSNLSTYLQQASADLHASEKGWKELCSKQKDFAKQFANKYPDKDQVREFAKKSEAKTQGLVKEFILKTEGSTAPHHDLDAMVQAYLEEIRTVQEQYKEVTDLNTEVKMYEKKVKDLSKSKKADETKTARNMEKMEQAVQDYETKLDDVIEEMKAVYAKHNVVMKATYVAYWSSQLRAFDLLSDTLVDTRGFVSGSVEGLRSMDISSISEADLEKFSADIALAPSSKAAPMSPIEDKVADPPVPAV